MRNLVINAAPADKEAMIKEINTIGRMKLVVFRHLHQPRKTRRVDLLLVGDSMKETKLDKALKRHRSRNRQRKKAIVYADVQDGRLYVPAEDVRPVHPRDILEYPHEKAVNKLNI